METLFENKYTNDKETIKEYLIYSFWKRPSAIVSNILLVCMFMFFLSFYLSWNASTDNKYFSLFFMLWILIVWTVVLVRFLMSLRLAIRRNLEMNEGKPPVFNYLIFEDKIDLCFGTSESKSSIVFALIKKVAVTKNLILLITKAKLLVILRKDSFTKGTYDEWLRFLREKGFVLFE